MRTRSSRTAAFAAFLAVCVLLYCSGPAYVVAFVDRLREPAPPTPENDLGAAARALASLLGRDAAPAPEAQRGGAPSPEERLRVGALELDAQLAALRERDRRIRDGFERAAERIAERALPEEIRDRQREMRARYEAGSALLETRLASVTALRQELEAKRVRGDEDGAQETAERLLEELGALREALREGTAGAPHHALDPEALPIRSAPETTREPRLERHEFVEARRVVQLAAAADPLPFLLAQADPDEPLPDDLLETPDAAFTPGIRALATSLGDDPLAIFNWVRQNVLFVPTFGSVQGAEGCRRTRECNAHDTASLLVALLRVSGVPARYAIGTLELSPELFRSALGDFDDLDAALRLAASGGIPVTKVRNATQAPVAVRMEHVWVEAFVDFAPGRGAAAGAGDTWVPLDAALKPTAFTPPADLPGELGLDPAPAVAAAQAAGTVGPDGNSATGADTAPLAAFFSSSHDAMLARLETLPDETSLGEIFGGMRVVAAPLAVLPASPAGRILVIGSRLSALQDNLRHRVVLQVLGEDGSGEQIRFEAPTAALAGRRVTLGFGPASLTDDATIEAFGGLLQTPPYLVQLRPILFVDGEPVASGAPGAMGSTLRVRVTFSEPSGLVDRAEHLIPRGAWAALALDLQRGSEEEAESRRAGYEATMALLDAAHAGTATQDVEADAVFGEILHLHGLSYFAQVEGFARVAANQNDLVEVRRPAEGLVTYGPSFRFAFGAPVEISHTGMSIDVQRVVTSSASRSGDREREVSHRRAVGHFASAAEHLLFQSTVRAQAVSAVRLIGEANARGIPVFTVDASNAAAVLPQLTLAPEVVADVADAAAAGKVVYVPRDEVPLLAWRGVGYIVLDPATGAGAYLISGGLAGGSTAEGGGDDPLGQLDNWLDGFGVVGDILKPLVRVIRVLGKVTSGFDTISIVIDVLAALVAALIVWTRTGDPWRTLAAFALSFLLNYVVGLLIMRLLFVFPWGTLAALVILGLSLFIENLLIDWLSSRLEPEWLRRLRRRIDAWAEEPPRLALAPGLGLRGAPA